MARNEGQSAPRIVGFEFRASNFPIFAAPIFNFRAILSHRVSPFIDQRLLASMFTKWRKSYSCTNEILGNFAAVLHYKLYGCENSSLQFVKKQTILKPFGRTNTS